MKSFCFFHLIQSVLLFCLLLHLNFYFYFSFKEEKQKRRVIAVGRSRLVLPSLHHAGFNENKLINARRGGGSTETTKDTPVGTSLVLRAVLCERFKENENGIHAFMGDLRMTNTTFPVFLMDTIRLRSHGKETPVSWLHKEPDCLRTGYLNVLLLLSFFCVFEFSSTSCIHRTCYLRQWLISIRTLGQGALL